VIRAAIVGVGRWGQHLVECTQDQTDKIRFTTGVARTPERAASFRGPAVSGVGMKARRRHGVPEPPLTVEDRQRRMPVTD
jgi:hypothetical protein